MESEIVICHLETGSDDLEGIPIRELYNVSGSKENQFYEEKDLRLGPKETDYIDVAGAVKHISGMDFKWSDDNVEESFTSIEPDCEYRIYLEKEDSEFDVYLMEGPF